MKKKFPKVIAIVLMMMLGVGFIFAGSAFAEGEGEAADSSNDLGTSISLSPTSASVQLASSSEYINTFEITNDGDNNMDVEVYAAPYSYTYSEAEDSYQLGFSNENSFTQVTRWITFKDAGGSWVEKPNFTIKPKDTLTVEYKISTPSNIPAGGQYAVLFAHTLSGTISASGIKTEASPGIVLYGRSLEGEIITKAEITESKIEDSIDAETGKKNVFHATAKIKNSGNVDFNATGVLTVSPIFGGPSYTTDNNGVRISVIPETELSVSDEWEDAPDFGVYKISWKITAGGETQVVEKLIFVNPLPFIIITIIVLTILIIWIIITVRKRKENRARLVV
jgi:hypothetical protein